MNINLDLDCIKFNEMGLIPVIIQDYRNKNVLMLGYMNRESLERTFMTGETWFWSRSRNELWHKGETSGNIQKVIDILLDCDNDTLLIKVEQKGAACHTGSPTCFFKQLLQKKKQPKTDVSIIYELLDIIDSRFEERPEGSYVTRLFNGGEDRILKKVVEEAGEVAIAGKNRDKDEIIYETADLIFHLMIMMRNYEISFEEIYFELKKRRQ
ncbi:MAG TPA: bifunctional phosphoribosyl-AMP cyclohydrolase/phosphoribosyl-ATP diphosphatase HisIE [Thermoanaerobacterales bacterium]|nr:bifunctional phosphoribosyl-AMP cyclohydrolase/phosphoribosyl-ATP diphosphatase HisIE [Thermoanaerobacterales bacterium]